MTKIICVGHQKTGTTSLARALTSLGYTIGNAHFDLHNNFDWKVDDPYENIKEVTLRVLSENDGIEDTPSAHFHKEMDEAFPGSKFILTRRDTDNWMKSFKGFFKDKGNDIRKWMYGVDRITGNEDIIRGVYERKNDEIIEYFKDRPDDFLIMDLEKGDGWLKLVTFLGDDFLLPFPHENKAQFGWHSKKNRRRRNVLARAFYAIAIVVLLIIWSYQ